MFAKILISSNPDNLRAALSEFSRTATVEAEYGDVVVEGTEATLAHHGPRADQPCPCLGNNLDLNVEAIGVSHFDLDTLGGVMRVLGEKTTWWHSEDLEASRVWYIAAKVDVLGVHKLAQIGKGAKVGYRPTVEEWWPSALSRLHAFWAWSEANRLSPPRDGSVQDCTEFFTEAIRVLRVILGSGRPTIVWAAGGKLALNREHDALMVAGRAWAEAKAKLEADSFVTSKGGVILRMADTFTNHLYEHDWQPALAVVALNTKTDSVTVSLADPIDGVNCCALMQRLFGPLAGGHAGIAGTPRGEVYMLHDAERVMDELILEIAAATTEVIPA